MQSLFQRLAALFILAFASQCAFAQFAVTAPVAAASAPPAVSPSYIMPPGKMYVNPKTIFAARKNGLTGFRFGVSCDVNANSGCYNNGSATPTPGNASSDPNSTGGSGNFRVGCDVSHMSNDDPIVWPGHPGMTHLHVFFGNTSTSAASVLDDMSLVGTSTCIGGMVNASGYWAPVPIYHCPSVAVGCDRSRDGEVQVIERGANAYYKCPASGSGADCTNGASYGPYTCNAAKTQCTLNNPNAPATGAPVMWAPPGFRVITGNASSRVPLDQNMICSAPGGQTPFTHIPTSAESAAAGGCTDINYARTVQQCWDGQNLDSPTHSAHAIPEVYYTAALCDNKAFPIRIMAPAMQIHFDIKNNADLDYIRLSSDPPCADEPGGVAGTASCNGKPNNGQPGGWTNHLDWVNGWSHAPNAGGFGKGTWTDIILKNCINVGQKPYRDSLDCHDNNIGSPLDNGVYYQVTKP